MLWKANKLKLTEKFICYLQVLAALLSLLAALETQNCLALNRDYIDPPNSELAAVTAVAPGSETGSDLRSAENAISSAQSVKLDQTNPTNGAYTFSVPLALPPGVNGFTPEVAISYQSDGSRFSSISPGFGLSTDNCIWRSSPPTINLNGELRYGQGVPSFSPSDTFSLGGQRLVACGADQGGDTQSCPNGTFRTLRNDFARVEKQPAGLSQGWRVTQPDGSQLEYNDLRQDSSRAQSFDNTFAWCLSSITRDGNKINYEYADYGQGLKLVTSIKYGGHSESTHIWQIQFEWENRSDISESYSSGSRILISKRLAAINVMALPSTLYSRYVLDYETSPSYSGSYRLRSITQHGKDGASGLSMPPYLFSYAPDSAGYTNQTAPQGLSSEARFVTSKRDRIYRAQNHDDRMNYDLISNLNSSVVSVDINSDGFSDIVRHDSQVSKVWINTGANDWVYDTNWSSKLSNVPLFGRFETLESSFAHQDLNSSSNSDGFAPSLEYIDHGVRFVDLNGDGKLDIVRAAQMLSGHQYNGAGAWYCDTSNTEIWVGIWDGAMNGGSGGYNTTLGASFRTALLNNSIYFIRQESGAIPSPGCWVSFPTGSEFGDVNGDGLLDLVKSYGSNPSGGNPTPQQGVYLNTGSSFVPAPSGSFGLPAIFNELYRFHYRNKGLRLADINGDGLSDIVQDLDFKDMKAGGDLPYSSSQIWINHGSGWVLRADLSSALSATRSLVPHSFLLRRRFGFIDDQFYGGWSNIPSGSDLIDLNGDGRDDILYASLSGTKRALLQSAGSWLENSLFQTPIAIQRNRDYPNSILNNSLCPSDGYTIGCLLNGAVLDRGVRFLNANADGIPDLLEYGSYWDTNGLQSSAPRLFTSNLRFDRDLLSTIKTPLGASVSVTYDLVHSLSPHQGHSMPFSKIVVKSITAHNGRSGGVLNAEWGATTEYSYYFGRYDTNTNSFAGFRSVVKKNPEIDGKSLYTTSWFKNGINDFCMQGATERVLESQHACKVVNGPGGLPIYNNCVQFLGPTIDTADVSNLGIFADTLWQYQACPSGAGAMTGPFFQPATSIINKRYEALTPEHSLSSSQTLYTIAPATCLRSATGSATHYCAPMKIHIPQRILQSGI